MIPSGIVTIKKGGVVGEEIQGSRNQPPFAGTLIALDWVNVSPSSSQERKAGWCRDTGQLGEEDGAVLLGTLTSTKTAGPVQAFFLQISGP